ncbi:MAG: phosphoribosyl-AMP cyclohydrolase [Methanimicrococcus sp.]|nr:phosphoribosyl-AMP cyclohydrolase [Methanimicrococcus sp.]
MQDSKCGCDAGSSGSAGVKPKTSFLSVDFSALKFENGLIPAIVQDADSKEVLMFAFMNEEALKLTLETKIAHYWSRSRQSLWKKGETSGHFQRVEQIYFDCDADALLLTVKQTGGACHNGYKSCFYRTIDGAVTGEKVFDEKDVY